MTDEAWLRRLAGYGLPGAPAVGKPGVAITEVIDAVTGHGLIGVLAAAVAEGPVPLAAHEERLVADAHAAAMRTALVLEETLLEATAVLGQAGIDHRVLKGAALAHLVHADPSERSFGTNDLLVLGDGIERATQVLAAAGLPTGTDLSLHSTLVEAPPGSVIDMADVGRDPIEFPLAGRAVRTLPLPMHLVRGALAAAGEVGDHLGDLRDLALLGGTADLDVDRVVAMATRWGCATALALGLRRTAVLRHPPNAIERWAAAYEVPSP